MVDLTALWIPIVVSALVVFVASSVLHMVLTYHRSDYKHLPNEDAVRAAIRAAGAGPGLYSVPYCPSGREMGSPEMMEKYRQGPVALLTLLPSGPPAMGKYLGKWFGFCLVISVFVAYLTGRTVAPGVDYLTVFRVAGTTAFMGYGASYLGDAVWKGQPLGNTARAVFDGLVYALLTAGVFGWLWP